jgi:hypothetical protein
MVEIFFCQTQIETGPQLLKYLIHFFPKLPDNYDFLQIGLLQTLYNPSTSQRENLEIYPCDSVHIIKYIKLSLTCKFKQYLR